MKVNGVDVKRYGGKQLKVERQAPQDICAYEWVDGAAVPHPTDQNTTASLLSVYMKFKGEERDEIARNISLFLSLFGGGAEIILDGYKGAFHGYLTASNIKKTIIKERYTLQIELDGYFYDNEETEIIDAAEKYIDVAGSRKTPCIITAHAIEALTNYTIGGAFEDITIETLAAGETIIIDGEKGTVTINGENAFETVDLWTFPVLQPGKNKVTVTDSAIADVTIAYKPMWL